jgi:type IV fimbrial biogenesis protein FimT
MRQRGLTLLELLVTLTVVTVVAFAAVPTFGWLVLDARMTADVNAFVTSIQLARSEAAKRAAAVVVCSTADRRVCGGAELRYETGWMVFVDENGDERFGADAGEPLLFSHAPAIDGTIRSNRSRYVFRPYYRRSTNGTIVFCDRRGADAARAVIVSYTGRPRVSTLTPGGRALDCTALGP